jgi:hypothetical protein
MEAPEVKDAIAKTGGVAHPSSPAEAKDQIARELKAFDAILRAVGVKK